MKYTQLVKKIFVYALVAEGISIIVQLGFVGLHNFSNLPDVSFNNDFMTFPGFFIFQIGGFFLSFVFFYILMVKDRGEHVSAGIWFFLFSVLIEISFYLITSISFTFAYAYSFLDKFIAILLAFFTYKLYKDAFYKTRQSNNLIKH